MLKDGGYFEYGPKVIPNPNAEGSGGGGGGSDEVQLHLEATSDGYIITESLSEIKSLIVSGKTPYITPDEAGLANKYTAYSYGLYNDEIDKLFFGKSPLPYNESDGEIAPLMEFYSDDVHLAYYHQ